jgi:hypothetical protein
VAKACCQLYYGLAVPNWGEAIGMGETTNAKITMMSLRQMAETGICGWAGKGMKSKTIIGFGHFIQYQWQVFFCLIEFVPLDSFGKMKLSNINLCNQKYKKKHNTQICLSDMVARQMLCT